LLSNEFSRRIVRLKHRNNRNERDREAYSNTSTYASIAIDSSHLFILDS